MPSLDFPLYVGKGGRQAEKEVEGRDERGRNTKGSNKKGQRKGKRREARRKRRRKRMKRKGYMKWCENEEGEGSERKEEESGRQAAKYG